MIIAVTKVLFWITLLGMDGRGHRKPHTKQRLLGISIGLVIGGLFWILFGMIERKGVKVVGDKYSVYCIVDYEYGEVRRGNRRRNRLGICVFIKMWVENANLLSLIWCNRLLFPILKLPQLKYLLQPTKCECEIQLVSV